MNQKAKIQELQELSFWLGKTKPHPDQTHGLGESDAEIIKISKNFYLASTVDAVSEEIAFGLYQDPFLMGYMTATASFSDLAAVGADPIGLLFSSQWKMGTSSAFKAEVARGLKSVISAQKTHLLGGDTGSALSTVLAGTAIGKTTTKPLSRLGMKPGDTLFISGNVGVGPAFAFQRVLGGTHLSEKEYRPKARLDLGKKLLGVASAMMDTSDGVAMCLHTLCELNQIGVELYLDPKLFHPKAIESVHALSLPTTSLLFGEHGDFQLLFSVPKKNLARFKKLRLGCVELGRVVKRNEGSSIVLPNEQVPLSWNLVSDLPRNNLEDFRQTVLALGERLQAFGLP